MQIMFKMNYFSLVILIYLVIVIACFSDELPNKTSVYAIAQQRLPHLFDRVPYPPSGVIPMLNRKIFGGKRVSIREHPYMASIRRNVAHYLVGTIILKNLILTVAHPLVDVSIAELSVVVGENYADRGSMLHTVILVVVHENFDQSTLEHDIALLRIYEEITFKGNAKSISFIDMLQTLHGSHAFVTGWGRCDRTGKELCLPRSTRYTTGEKFDPMLKTMSFYLKENDSYCAVYTNKGLYLGPGMMCQGNARVENAVAPCLAVPGAPLVINAHLAGILSWGFSCGHSGDLPAIYTNLQFYQPWIFKNIMVLRDIPNVYWLKLFEAKRAYVLMEWLRLTRVVPLDAFSDANRHMEPLQIDIVLARLSGTIYDIRDYINESIHHKYKMTMYQTIRQNLEEDIEMEKKRAEFIAIYKTRNEEMRPFIQYDYKTPEDNNSRDYIVE